MINSKSSMRYRRRDETKNILVYIHGSFEGSLYGAWDYLSAHASYDLVCKLISSYKRGKFIQGIFGKAVSDYQKSDEAIKQSVALKYRNFLSRRSYQLICKTQSSFYDNEKEVWLPRNMKCLGIDLRVPKLSLSDAAVDRFVKSLDIGHVSQIPGIPGVSRTVTGLVFMVIDLHLRVPHLARKLTWFNEIENHFIFQFSDDGAPETSQTTMSIGSMVCWNFGNEVRSRDFQYLLHCVSVGEKDQVMHQLWKQHTDEMKLLEGNLLNICEKECTVEFQPGADMSWQSWAANEVNQAATYPSPYANVSKSNMNTMGGTISAEPDSTWQPYSDKIRDTNITKLQSYVDSLPDSLSESTKHQKQLNFMAENGIRQLGPPRIGSYVCKLRPEPLHCEINAWQHFIDVVYIESVRRNCFDKFICVLESPIASKENTNNITKKKEIANTVNKESVGDRVRTEDVAVQSEIEFRENLALNVIQSANNTPLILGCGLGYLASKVKDHYNVESNRHNKLPIRLIGSQAIALARYSYRLVDALQSDSESEALKVKRLALGKICEYLRNAGGLFNRIELTSVQIADLKESCEMYFNLMSLFFFQPCQCYNLDCRICHTLPCSIAF